MDNNWNYYNLQNKYIGLDLNDHGRVIKRISMDSYVFEKKSYFFNTHIYLNVF